MDYISSSPPRPSAIKYDAPHGTRWDKEKEAAGGSAAFDYPSDPRNIGPWILGECVGKGASGRVKIARHRYTGQLAAVKILPLAPLVHSRASIATRQRKYEKQRLGIDREITMMKLMNHPNILRLYDVFEGATELFLVLEYVEGGELFDFLVNKGRLTPEEALPFFKQIVYGLNYAHTFSIIHRDLKPENILISSLSPPLIKIADWGMAAFSPPSMQLETSCGSPHYASPEIVNGEKYQGNATDIWSCGVILFALLTGRLPFDDKDVKKLLEKVKTGVFEMPKSLDPLAQDLIGRMLVLEVDRRITIPEILSHPWMRFFHQSPANSTLPTPPLPPSPSTLARPLSDPSLIDPQLFESLLTIWGRHSDPEGSNIKYDLCAPVGEGVYAKAFYFLLGRYRDDKSRLEGNVAENKGQISTDDMNSLFNVGWELDTRMGEDPLQRYEGYRRSRARNNTVPSRLAPIPVSGLAPPILTRNLTTGSRDKPPSPIGPRSPYRDHQRSRDHSAPPGHHHYPYPASSFAPERFTAGPRPPLPKRGYTYSQPASDQTSKHLPHRGSSHRPVQRHQRPKFVHRDSAPIVPVAQGQRAFPRPSQISNLSTVENRGVKTLPLAAPPKTNPVHQETLDEIAQKVNQLVVAEDVSQNVVSHGARSSEDKENKSVGEEGWSYIANDEVRIVGREMGNMILGDDQPTKVHNGNERKARPPPLDFALTRKRSTILGMTSPTMLSPPMNGHPSRRLPSPVVGEFKGWFSSLFGLKNQTGAGILYSPDHLDKTRWDIGRMLQGLGVRVMGIGFIIPEGQGDQPDLRCLILDNHPIATVHLGAKGLRFKIELSPTATALDSPMPSAPNSSLLSPPLTGHTRSRNSVFSSKNGPSSLVSPIQPHFPSGSTAIMLLHEKGSMTTFKAVWRKLKSVYGEAPSPYLCLSPAIGSTPMMEQPQRFAL
ncbi:Pkinase-domain-containing protein [Mycena floridula]|nr:Pkinase-domain-containing protein [Mycena floridula]